MRVNYGSVVVRFVPLLGAETRAREWRRTGKTAHFRPCVAWPALACPGDLKNTHKPQPGYPTQLLAAGNACFP
jgi:hypothetical protein